MKRKTLFLLMLLALVFLSGCNSLNGTNSNGNNNQTQAQIADCIASKATLYISTGCIACAKQEETLGEYYDYMTVVDCKQKPASCNAADITHVPTWIVNGEKFIGVHTFKDLKELTGC